jgi:O-antigen/teichoic acid export membrane protein
MSTEAPVAESGTDVPHRAGHGASRQEPERSLARRTLGGVAWNSASRVVGQIVQFAITATLARLLLPADFGLVAMLAVFTGFAAIFVDLGLAAALVQRKEVEERHLSSAFWVNIGGGVLMAATISSLSPAIAAFYGEPRLVALTVVASASFVIGATSIVQSALLKRTLNFRRLAIVDVTATAVGGIIAVGVAVAGLGVWSLVLSALAATAVRSSMLWFSTDWRPKRIIDRAAVRDLWRFSSHLLGFMMLNYWSANADNLLIGRFIGVRQLGIYSRAFSVMMLPISQIAGAATGVMFPALSGIQDDRGRVKAGYLRATRLIAIVAFPTFTGLIVVADRFIVAAYGDRWSAAVPLLRILCVAGLVRMMVATGSWIYQSQGRTDWMLRWGVVNCAATLIAFGVGLHWGMLGVTIAFAISSVLLAYPGIVIPGRLVGLSFQDVAGAVRQPAVAAAAMGLVVFGSRYLVPSGLPVVVQLLALVVIGIAAYGAALRLLGVDARRELAGLRGRHDPRMP